MFEYSYLFSVADTYPQDLSLAQDEYPAQLGSIRQSVSTTKINYPISCQL
jgi:hypothetical protein